MTPSTDPTATAAVQDVQQGAAAATAAVTTGEAVGVVSAPEAADVKTAATDVAQAAEESLPVVNSLEDAFAAVIHLVTRDIPEDPHAKALMTWFKGFRPA